MLRTYAPDTRLIIVGNAAMAPCEVTEVGGSVEHNNPEPGATWIKRLTARFPRHAWINPTPREHWSCTQSTTLIRAPVEDRVFALTPKELEAAMRALTR